MTQKSVESNSKKIEIQSTEVEGHADEEYFEQGRFSNNLYTTEPSSLSEYETHFTVMVRTPDFLVLIFIRASYLSSLISLATLHCLSTTQKLQFT